MAVEISPACARWLTALGYSRGEGSPIAAPYTMTQTKELILWLEESKIRLLGKKERAGLRVEGDEKHEVWVTSFLKYLKALGLKQTSGEPLSADAWNTSAEVRASVMERLVALAVEEEYTDAVEGHDIADATDTFANAESQATEVVSIDVEPYTRAVNELLKRVDLPPLPSEGVTPSMLLSALKGIRARFNMSLQKEAASASAHVKDLPSGIPTTDPAVHEFAATLRLLHLADLKQLQHKINVSLAELQAITGDPRTDTRRGRVGR